MRISDWSSDVCSSDLAKEQADVALDKLTEILSQGGDRDTLDFFVTGSLYSFIDPLFIAIADQGDKQLRGARSEIAESSERIRGLLFLSLALSVAAVLSALLGLRLMSRKVVRPLEQMACALSADRLTATNTLERTMCW